MHSAALLLEMASKRMMRKQTVPFVTKSQVKQIILGVTEPKVFSTQASGTLTNTAGVVIAMTVGITEGDDVGNRSGTKIKVRHQTFRFRALAVGVDQSVRFILFSDTMNVGGTPTVTEVLPTTGLLSHYSDVREIQQHRYRILFDEIVDVSSAGPSVKTIHGEIKRQYPVFYNGITSAASSNGKGAVFLLVIGSTNTGVFDYDVQTVYNDS